MNKTELTKEIAEKTGKSQKETGRVSDYLLFLFVAHF